MSGVVNQPLNLPGIKGLIREAIRQEGEVPLGSSGIQIRLKVDLALAGSATAQDGATQKSLHAKRNANIPLDGPVLTDKPVTFKLHGSPRNSRGA